MRRRSLRTSFRNSSGDAVNERNAYMNEGRIPPSLFISTSKLERSLEASANFYLSSNGVILSEGYKHGFRSRFFQRVHGAKGVDLPD